jgi:acyl carrier protein
LIYPTTPDTAYFGGILGSLEIFELIAKIEMEFGYEFSAQTWQK